MWELIAWPFGKLLWLCYEIFKNYGWALFVFTLLIKLLMLPSSYKTQISTAKMSRLNPKIEAIKKKYGDNKEKINEATMELYNRENINPMGSCLPMFLPFIILFAIVEVVYAPLTYLGDVSKDKLKEAQSTVYDTYVVSAAVKNHETSVNDIVNSQTTLYDTLVSYKAEEKSTLADYSDERLKALADVFTENKDLDIYFNDPAKVSPKLVAAGASSRLQLLVLSVAKDYPGLFDSEVAALCSDFDYTFLGIYLGKYPSWNSILILIPIISLVSQLALTVVSQWYQKKSGSTSTNKTMNIMLYTMPLISFWIAFSYPAGIGIYWIFSSILSLVQVIGLNMYLTPARIDKIVSKETKKARKKPSLYQMALEQQKAQLAGQKSVGEKALDEALTEDIKLSRSEKKEAERYALNEARRRSDVKYGAEFEDDNEALVNARKRSAERYGDRLSED